MSKKLGVIGLSVSLATGAALFGSFTLIEEMKQSEKQFNLDLDALNSKIETVSEDVSSLNKLSKGSGEDDLVTISAKVIELEEHLAKLTKEVESIPTFVQVDENGEEITPAKNPATTPTEVVTTPVVTNTTPTVENPTFATSTRVNFRADASIKSQVKKTLPVGEVLTWVDNLSVTKDGYTWIKVKDANGNYGWVAQQYTTKH